MASRLSPALGDIWRATQPSGKIDVLALDIPLQATEKNPLPVLVDRFGLETVEAAAGGRTFLRYACGKR